MARTENAVHDKIRLAQLRGIPPKWDLARNFSVFEQAVARATGMRADLLVTPECWLDGYAAIDPASTPQRILDIAQPLESSRYVARAGELAREHRLWICFGFTSLEDGRAFNAAGLWNADGERVGLYRKTHLQRHDLQYAAGDELPVFQTPWGTMGILICADRRWPETSRVLRVQGARLILNPTYGFWTELNEAMIRTRSYENELYFAFTHPRQSLVTGTKGEVILNEKISDDGTWTISVTELDLAAVTDHGHIADRRPGLYGALAESRGRDGGAASVRESRASSKAPTVSP